jgi:hypothetical protein
MVEWLIKNREWVFSGIGVLFISGSLWVGGRVIHRFRRSSRPLEFKTPVSPTNALEFTQRGEEKVLTPGPQVVNINFPVPFRLPPNVTCHPPATLKGHMFSCLTVSDITSHAFRVQLELDAKCKAGSFVWKARGLRENGETGEYES